MVSSSQGKEYHSNYGTRLPLQTQLLLLLTLLPHLLPRIQARRTTTVGGLALVWRSSVVVVVGVVRAGGV